MLRLMTAVSLLALLSACGDGNPLFDARGNPIAAPDADGGGTNAGGDNTGDPDGDLDAGEGLPPGTDDPRAGSSILRFEDRDGQGGGLVTTVSYNARNDRFNVDNLGFDGPNVYTRGDVISTLGGYPIYDADDTTPDFLTGQPVAQIAPYRAIFKRSSVVTEDGDPRTSVAVVRTGGYVGYGFGGFLYERNGEVVLPDEGQAQWNGQYAGLRVFDPIGGLEYTRGDALIAVDFEDFNANDAVRGRFFNRVAFDENGDAIPLGGEGELILPDLPFVVQEGASSITTQGEIQGELRNAIINSDGTVEIYEDGKYFGVIAGDTTRGDGGEVVGVFVVESDDPRFEGVTVQETGAFLLTR